MLNAFMPLCAILCGLKRVASNKYSLYRKRYNAMRKTTALTLAIIMLTTILVFTTACGGGELDGTYKPVHASSTAHVTFKGNNITIVSEWGDELKGTFEIDGNFLIMDFGEDGSTTAHLEIDKDDKNIIYLEGEKYKKN